jgi:virginiamycin A acetyltransferase
LEFIAPWRRTATLARMTAVLLTTMKALLHGIFLALAFPMALLSGFGRSETVYLYFAQTCALAPGILGDYLRIAYYKLTLLECALESRIQFGSFFAHPQARVGRGVYIGSYCVLGRTAIGDRTQIASTVQILSGRKQHRRDAGGRIRGSEEGVFEQVDIGADCWIGAAAIVMANVGAGSTIGAGSIVTRPVPAGSIAVGNPARVIPSASPDGV